MDLTPNVGDYREENTMTKNLPEKEDMSKIATQQQEPSQDAKDAAPAEEQQWSLMDKAFAEKFKAGGYQYGTDEKQDAHSWFRFGYFAAMEAKKEMNTIAQDAKDAARYRDDLISCRDMVETERTQYERLAFMCWKLDVTENYVKEAQQLSDLLDRIDAAIKETPC